MKSDLIDSEELCHSGFVSFKICSFWSSAIKLSNTTTTGVVQKDAPHPPKKKKEQLLQSHSLKTDRPLQMVKKKEIK